MTFGRPEQDDARLLDLCGRIMLTHALAPGLAERALGIPAEDSRALVDGTPLSATLDADQSARLALLTNILVRLEIRCRHDGGAIRRALQAPLDALGGAAPTDRIGDGVDALRAVRAAVDHVELPKVRWWRIGH